MLRYVLRRILLAVPTLLVISMAVFGLNKCAPYDEVSASEESSFGELRQQETAGRRKAKKLGLDKPAFYFTLTTAAFPDTLHKIFPTSRRKILEKLCAQTGNWPAVENYEKALREVNYFDEELPDTLQGVAEFRLSTSDLMKNEQVNVIDKLFSTLREAAAALPPNSHLTSLLDSLGASIAALHSDARPANMNIPVFHWHGFDNQYHCWLSGFATGDWGFSRDAEKPVWEALRTPLFHTLVINGLAIFLTYLVAVPLGVAMARRRDRLFDHIARWALLLLFSMPVFWLGSLLILFFATPDFGFFLINGIGFKGCRGDFRDLITCCLNNFDKFILPILTLSLHALAVLALQMRGSILENIGQDFIRTARAKGVRENAVFWRHAFRNALFPIITVFASVLPAIFTGSLVVEYLFAFPGLGMKTHGAFSGKDYPVLFAILMFAATLTILGNLIADLLYAWADPRVRFSRR